MLICISYAMPDIDEDEVEEIIAEDRCNISKALQLKISPVDAPDEDAQPLGFGDMNPDFTTLDLSPLVDWQLQHQSRHAAVRVRTRVGEQLQTKADISIRRQLIRRFHEVLKQE